MWILHSEIHGASIGILHGKTSGRPDGSRVSITYRNKAVIRYASPPKQIQRISTWSSTIPAGRTTTPWNLVSTAQYELIFGSSRRTHIRTQKPGPRFYWTSPILLLNSCQKHRWSGTQPIAFWVGDTFLCLPASVHLSQWKRAPAFHLRQSMT